jgi:hypothetical protein
MYILPLEEWSGTTRAGIFRYPRLQVENGRKVILSKIRSIQPIPTHMTLVIIIPSKA